MTGVSLQYKIPLYDDKSFIAELQSAAIKDGVLLINCSVSKEAKEFSKPSVVFEEKEIVMNFE
jgi:hypothetical protein